MSAQSPSVYEIFDIKSNDGGKSVDLRGGVISFSYYEDVLSPYISAQVQIVNTGESVIDKEKDITTVYNGLPIRGGEVLNIRIPSTSQGPGLDFTEKNNNPLFVASITNILQDALRETFTLNLVSREAITNETAFVGKKFSPKITSSVRDIIEKYLLSEKNIDDDETDNDYAFYGNMRKPFTILTWLSTKSVPAEAGGQRSTAGYFFYETKQGYHFKSVDALIKKGSIAEYEYTPNIIDTEDPKKDFKILEVNINRNQKLIDNLERGSYCSHRMYYDPLNGKFTTQQQGEFKMSDYSEKMENLGQNFNLGLPPVDKSGKTLADLPTRIVTGVVDRGITEKSDKNSKKQNADQMNFHSQAMMRYQTIFNETITITIPLNTMIIAGNILKLNFFKMTVGKEVKRDDSRAGLYMVKQLVHFYDNTGSFTKLKLIRDTIGVKDK